MARKKQERETKDTAIRLCAGAAELLQRPGTKMPKGKFYYETGDGGYVAIDNSNGKIKRKTLATLDECVAFFN